nr:MAG TPA: hypothetical protein [Caudoviricetes sp.]
MLGTCQNLRRQLGIRKGSGCFFSHCVVSSRDNDRHINVECSTDDFEVTNGE